MPSSLNRNALLRLRDPALKGRWIAFVGSGSSTEELAIESITAVFNKTPSRSRFYGGITWDFPEMSSTDAISMTFYETYDYKTTAWLREWHRLIFDPNTSIYGLPADYYRNIQVNMYGTESSSAPVAELELIGCWPTDISPYDYNYHELDGRLIITCTFAVNTMTFKLV